MNKKFFDDAYRYYASNIFRYVYFKVSDYELAGDLTADTFTRFWKLLQKETVINVKALLFSIANGIVIDYYRKKKNRKMVSLEAVDERLLGFIDKNEEYLSTKEELDHVYIQLKKLKKEYQDILLLYYVEELEVSEIGLIFHKTENNVRVLIHRALKALKRIL